MNLIERREQRRKIRRKIAWTMATVGVIALTGSAALNAYSRTHAMKYSSNEFDVVDKIELDT